MNAPCFAVNVAINVTDENGLTVSAPSPRTPTKCRRFVSPPPPPRDRSAADLFLNSPPPSQPLKAHTNRASEVNNNVV